MKLAVTIARSLQAGLLAELRDIERAVVSGTRDAGRCLKTELLRQVDPLAPLQDVITDDGDIVVPVDPRYLGLWLTGLFGDPNTTDNGDGSYDHEFASGGEDLPSYTIEVGTPKVPAFFRHAGVKLNSIALEFTRSGAAAATHQRHRAGRDPLRHDPGRHADQPDLQPDESIPCMDGPRLARAF
jgi:Phage tail tube protein